MVHGHAAVVALAIHFSDSIQAKDGKKVKTKRIPDRKDVKL